MAQREIKEGEKGLVDGVWSIYGPGGWEPVEKLPGGGALPPNDLGERDSNMIDLDPEILKFIQDKNLTAPFSTSTNMQSDIMQNFINSGLIDEEAGKEDIGSRYEKYITGVESTLRAQRSRIGQEFAPLLQKAREEIPLRIGAAKAALTRQAGGLGLDTATQGAIEGVRQEAEANLVRLKDLREQAMQKADLNFAQTLIELEEAERKDLADLETTAWNRKIDIFNIGRGLAADQRAVAQEQRMQTQMDWNIMSKLPEGKSWISPSTGLTYIGTKEPDPFFKSADIISIMKNTPIGEEIPPITDPNTGQVWTMAGIGKPSINQKVFQSIDASGNMHIVSYDEVKNEVIGHSVVKGAGKPMKPTTTDTDETLTAGEVRDIKYLTAPPQWFRDRLQRDRERAQVGQLTTPQPLTEERIREQWNEMRKQAKNLGVIDNESLAE